jgi:hypothetical protein
MPDPSSRPLISTIAKVRRTSRLREGGAVFFPPRASDSGASAVEFRNTSSVCSRYSLPLGEGVFRRTSVISAVNARRAISLCDMRTVVSGGSDELRQLDVVEADHRKIPRNLNAHFVSFCA